MHFKIKLFRLTVVNEFSFCIGPRQRRDPIQTSWAITTDRGHITGPLGKNPFPI
jgi:hypothetical protein